VKRSLAREGFAQMLVPRRAFAGRGNFDKSLESILRGEAMLPSDRCELRDAIYLARCTYREQLRCT